MRSVLLNADLGTDSSHEDRSPLGDLSLRTRRFSITSDRHNLDHGLSAFRTRPCGWPSSDWSSSGMTNIYMLRNTGSIVSGRSF